MAGVYYHNLLYFYIPYAKIIRKFHINLCKDGDALIDMHATCNNWFHLHVDNS